MGTNNNSTSVLGRRFSSAIGEQFVPLLFAFVLTVGLVSILSFNIVTQPQVSLALGEQATETILAPESLSYDSPVLTAAERRQVTASIYRYTSLDRSVGREQNNKARLMFLFIEVVRADSLADLETKMRYLQAIETVAIDAEVAEIILTLTPQQYSIAKNEILVNISEGMQEEVRDDSLSQARQAAARRIGFDLSPDQEQMIVALAPQFIVPNVFFDEEATNTAREEVASTVQPVRNEIRVDEPIIRAGETVTEIHLEELERFGLLDQGTDWFSVGAAFIFSLLTAIIMALYWRRFQRRQNRAYRYLTILAVLILLFALAAKLMVLGRQDWIYLYPAAALFMLLTVISDARLAVLVAAVIAALVGYMSNNSLELALYTSVGGIISILTLRDTQRFYAFFRAGIFGSVGNIAVILLFQLTQTTDPTRLGLLMLYAFVNGAIISPMITFAGFFFVGLFGVITVVQLQDLSRLDHPLLKELLRRAPGTYHHSIMVANLAEQAAERIEANSTLVRVGSFYHDIGKMNRPAFFTENQEGGVNPHDTLDPYSSARIIIAHVTEGMEMAKRYRLPNRIQDFIFEHHGDRVVRVFYEKARAAAGDDADSVDIERFRHKGRRPRTRETGIVLLADTIDAAASAIRPSTVEEIEKLVNSLVDDHLKAGQLDNSDLTMGDLKMIRESFIETLKGRFHVRVRYPGNDEMMGQQEPSNTSDNGRVSLPIPIRENSTQVEET